MEDDLALFSSRLKLNRLDETTIEILNRLLCSTEDVKELQNLRTDLVQFLRSKFLSIVRQSADKPVVLQLSTLDFFFRAFDILDDVQSCFSLQFERLVIRDSSAALHPDLQVSCDEWLNFADDASKNDFIFIATEAWENAMSSLNRNGDGIDGLKDAAASQSSSNHSDSEDNILGIIYEEVSDGYDSHVSEQSEKDTGQGKRKRKTRKTKKKKKNKGRKVRSFAIDTYVSEVCKELKEKKTFMVYIAIEILGLPAFQRLLQRVRDIQASGGQRTYAAERLKTGGGIFWHLLQKENPSVYNLVAYRQIQLKTGCGVPDAAVN